MRLKLFSHLTLVAALATVTQVSAAEKAKNDRVVKDGMMISMEFTLKSPDGKLIDSSKGRPPLRYIHGQKMIPPGLEKELTGMKVGAEKHVTVKPEDAYGPLNAKAFEEVPKEKLPSEGLKVGAILATKTPDGRVIELRVHEIKEKTVVIDMNHPMAGRTLVFDIKIVDVQPAPLPPASQPPTTAPARPSQPAKPAEPSQKK